MFLNDDTFFIVSHSFGSILALKLAEILESEGKAGKMIFIDGSPWMTTNWMNFLFPANPSYEDIQNIIATGYARKFTNNDAVIAEVMRQETFDLQLAKIVDIGIKNEKINSEDVRNYFSWLSKRLKIAQLADQISYAKLQASSPILVKAKDKKLKDIPSDLDLQQFFNIDMSTLELDGDHSSILQNPRLVEVINSQGSV